MMKDIDKKSGAANLRNKAEDLLKTKLPKMSSHSSEADMKKLIHELEVHQIELEMQNDELMRAKHEAQEIAEKYSELYDYSPSGYVTLSAAGKIQQLNFACAQMLGKERSLLLNYSFQNFVSIGTQSVFDRFFQSVVEQKTKAMCEVVLLINGGSPVFAELAGISSSNEQSMLISMADITERKLADDALKASEERFRTMANSIPALAWMSGPDGLAYWFNDRWYEYTGTLSKNIEGWTWGNILDPLMISAVSARWEECVASGTPFEMEISLKGTDGSYRPFISRAVPIKNSHGEVLQWFGTNTDITERKKTELLIRSLYTQAEHDSTIKTDLLNEVNHRVKNNLMMILGLILAEKDRLSDDNTFEASLDKFWSRINGLLHVHQMLSDSKWMPISITRLAERIGEAVINSSSDSRLAIKLCVEHSDIEILPRQAGNIAIVLNELITNSIKYAFTRPQSSAVWVTCQMEGNTFHLSFKDNGCGYPINVLQNNHRKVGLRLIHKLIEQMNGGRVELSNDNGAVTSLYWNAE
jgi:PAS domain S-box-containing protein